MAQSTEGGLLRPATNQTAFLKVGILGFAGSGKTFTAKEIAIGMAKEFGDGKPVAFFDTETGSDFLIPAFREAGVELLVAKSRAFVDLVEFTKEAEAVCSVAIVDSITHVWTELRNAWEKKLRRKYGLEFQDWGKVKGEWQQFTDLFLNSRMHMIVCGRAGYEYDYDRDEETGKKELTKTGTRMKTEGEMAYEPSLLIEMVRVNKSDAGRNKKAKGWVNRAVVIKDRTDTMNGHVVDYPTFESFRSVYEFLNLGGEHLGIDTSRSSEDSLDNPESGYARRQRVKVVLEEIQNLFVEAGLSSRKDDDKRVTLAILKVAFATTSWSAVEAMSLEALESGRSQVIAELVTRGLMEDPAVHLPNLEMAGAEV